MHEKKCRRNMRRHISMGSSKLEEDMNLRSEKIYSYLINILDT